MALSTANFKGCSIKDLYESMLYSCTKIDHYLDIMLNNAQNSGKYIDANVMRLGWERCYDAARESLENTYGKTMRRQVVKMIEKDLELIQMRRKVFG